MKDPKTEAYLIRNKFTKFVFREKLPFSEIDLVDARSNSARPHRSIDVDVVVRYGEAMEKGAEFTAIVVIRNSTRRQYRLATGLHRIEAAGCVKPKPIEALDAYIVDCEDDPSRETLLIHGINSIEGKAPTVDENLLLAAEYKRLFPETSNREISRGFAIKEDTLAKFMRQQDGEKRAHRLNCFAEYDSLKSQGLKLGLNRVQNDNTFARATQFAFNWKLYGSDGDRFVAEVLKCRTETVANDLIAKWEKEARKRSEEAKAPFGKPPRTKWQQVMSWCKTILKNEVPTYGLSTIPDADVASAMVVYETTAERLTRAVRILRARFEAMNRERDTV